jgi:hypothetical protein
VAAGGAAAPALLPPAWETMTLYALKSRARDAGLSDAAIDAADDTQDPRAHLLGLLLTRADSGGGGGGGGGPAAAGVGRRRTVRQSAPPACFFGHLC